MRTQATFVEDSAVEIIPAIVCEHDDDVQEVAALDSYRLRVRFHDGTAGIVEMSEMIHSAEAGVFSTLLDPSVFSDVGVMYGAVTWANGLDLAPDAMYEEFKRNGVWVLR